MMNYQSLAFWALVGLAVCCTSQCSYASHLASGEQQVDPSPDNISQLSRCERTCLDTLGTCGRSHFNYGACLGGCTDITHEAELVQFERAYLCFSQNASCDTALYNRYCALTADGGI